MILTRYLLGIVGALLILVVVVELLRRGKLRERHTFWWLIAGTLSLLVAVFPSILEALASALGIDVPINLVFFVGIVVLFLVCIQQSTELTRSEERTRTLAERVALLDDRVRFLEEPDSPVDSENEHDGSSGSAA
ncbi:DUF2304 domain-containing protein [Microbacterium sp. P01]|uniref:DUF2304 domain-containing protein n=1 Tax=unclassified Microbacterium TaxID=2609290 RepID=UPI00366E49D9